MKALIIGLVLAVAACGSSSSAADAGPDAVVILPDEREPCADTNSVRNPYFGDLHVHTTYSFDAIQFGTRATPNDAYDFARGASIGLPPFDDQGEPTRQSQLERPLDFAAVADHSELLAEAALCYDTSSAAYDSTTCVEYRESSLSGFNVSGLWFTLAVIAPQRSDFCEVDDCAGRLRDAWQRIQDAAEAAYDRTSACEFTSFVAYEYTGTPLGNNLHRNIIFKNRQVPAVPTSYVEATTPQEMWRQLEASCTNGGAGCEFLSIPHNSNLSGGQMFIPLSEGFGPLDAEEAEVRAASEPIMEIYQAKGSSECMLGFGDPLSSEDELCQFENVQHALCTGAPGDPPNCALVCSTEGGIGFLGECADNADFARTTLGAGIVEQDRIGANPFQLGFIGSTDTHNGTPGSVDEASYPGNDGASDAELADRLRPAQSRYSPGGLAVLWAEENSRDSLFEAMRRRETYATSGPRIIARMFAGWSYPTDLCDQSDFVERGYADGVPMGSVLPTRPGSGAPVLAISALSDAGTTATPGTPLQRIQVVKGWVEGGEPRYEVYEVAGDPDNGASVDATTCEPTGTGFDTLCAVWTDPDFDPQRPAYYYARIIENPTCRWSAHQCLAAGVDCTTLPDDDPLALCCDGSLRQTIQERAWTSPVWYNP